MLTFLKRPNWLVVGLIVAMAGLFIAACIPQDVTNSVSATRSDVAAIKADMARLSDSFSKLEKNVKEPTQLERETKDQVIKARADLLDYKMDYSTFKTTLVGAPATAASKTAKATPAKTGAITAELGKLQSALVGTPAKAGVSGKPGTPAKPGLLPTREQVESLAKTLEKIEARLSKIESAMVAK